MNEESGNAYLTKWKARLLGFAAGFGFQLAVTVVALSFVVFGAVLGGWMALVLWSMVPVALAALAFRPLLKRIK